MKNLALFVPPIRRLWEDRGKLIAQRDELHSEKEMLSTEIGGLRDALQDSQTKRSELTEKISRLEARLHEAEKTKDLVYLPSGVFSGFGNAPYMANSYPVASDFFHPLFSTFLSSINHRFQMHRKLWEFAFIEHKLATAGMLTKGKRGLCFGAGQEPLPALFAAKGCTIHATDAPAEVIGEKWTATKEFSRGLEDMNYRGMIDEESFFERVSYSTADMNHIPPELTDFDFCWSACCLEHLGSIDHGLEFIANSLNTLKIGGISIQTTELNLSSNDETVETGDTVLYRRRDIEAFIERMRDEGHEVESLTVSPPATPIDHHVDVPPYSQNPHLKLLLGQYVTTSIGIVIRRGR
ncbi:hypothetical protein F3X89_03685 [Rhizobium rhizogenes]|uniref:hypothetical protein n=1 Tax=Rhizobium rhizogenes TaxID=359 RepID=UPI00193DA992|nr:hypothetical protein [Rhizobium rhizogenes]QRM36937.1 hypothetical protein F3X89_03685 [Rhizobium rhizogenes]